MSKNRRTSSMEAPHVLHPTRCSIRETKMPDVTLELQLYYTIAIRELLDAHRIKGRAALYRHCAQRCRSTEACKIIPACLKIPAPVLPGNLASPCTANQPISESLSSILNSQNLAGIILHDSVYCLNIFSRGGR